MDKRFVIFINGAATAGKDTFIKHFGKDAYAVNFSSITCVIDGLKKGFGITVDKSDQSRKLLSDIGLVLEEYNNYRTNDTVENIITTQSKYMFVHMREGELIDEVIGRISFYPHIIPIKLLIRRHGIEPNTSNVSDARVHEYSYDYVYRIDTEEESALAAKAFKAILDGYQ